MDYMEQALSLAKLALGQVSPNPAVGALVVRNGEVVGQGYTQPPGSEHAEIVALRQAGDAARGGVMYVTLEPCCHYGRTPPCTEVIIGAGISEVHMAMLDPNSLVSGKGERELIENGIRTFIGEHENEAREINEAYIKYITTGIPFVTAKFAMSLDGKIATFTGDSRWISCEGSRRYVHSLRWVTDAIMVGVNTVIADDPQLTFRCGERGGIIKKQPLRVIVDSRGRTPATSRLFGEPGKTILALGRPAGPDIIKASSQASVELLELPVEDDMVDLKELFKELGKREITSVLVEGGGTLLGSLFDNRLIDKVIAFVAPIIIGGTGAVTAVGGRGVKTVAEAIKLEHVVTRNCEDDIIISGYVGD